MLLHTFLPVLFGVASATPFIASTIDNIHPTPTCNTGNMTVSTCCRNDWLLVTPENVKYPGYACRDTNTGADPNNCIAPALVICCTYSYGYIVTAGGDKDTLYQPEDFRRHDLEGA